MLEVIASVTKDAGGARTPPLLADSRQHAREWLQLRRVSLDVESDSASESCRGHKRRKKIKMITVKVGSETLLALTPKTVRQMLTD